ncbi:uncharacterized protein BYT42DRAFT_551374 [Radiomyces spectabilis]|uniref:uncharacterized protein n=1 Tax=Radiomyces spectabilis TaxID=64574 RepID=UPI002220A420|nr:uncharacterized protein BYT42DRAFT_551374 [Radiomyces spectabilis]KAI8393531.1 hypothetical protein BYT42DRAFT_551374 [Radiomyces spectabilis]
MSFASEYDDEYGPVVSAWGDQAKSIMSTDESESKRWDTLIDPSVKLGPAGIGTGNLHRKGRNYIPVDEKAILHQRLKTPIPGSKKNKLIANAVDKRTSSNPKPANKDFKHHSSTARSNSFAPVTANTTTTPTSSSRIPPRRRPASQINSAWADPKALAIDPFWISSTSSTSEQIEKPEEPEEPAKSEKPTQLKQDTMASFADAPISTEADANHAAGWNNLAPEETPSWLRAEQELIMAQNAATLDYGQINRPSFMQPNSALAANPLLRNDVTNMRKPPGLSPIHLYDQLPQKPSFMSNGGLSSSNPVIVIVDIELQENHHVPVSVRLYDDPVVLTKLFAYQYNISSTIIISHLLQMFTQQKAQALAKRQYTLQNY